MKKIIEYSNFTEFVISNNEITTISCRLKTFGLGAKIYCHAFDKLSNASMALINTRAPSSNQRPINCIMTIWLKINGVETKRDYDMSSYIGQDIPFYIDVLNIRDVNGNTLATSGTLELTTLTYKNVDFRFEVINSIRYKSETLSFYVKQTPNLEIVAESNVLPYIVAYDDVEKVLHFNMPMPASGIYELEESYDSGATWARMLMYTSQDENLEIPGYPGYYIEDKLNGSSTREGCNNSLDVNFYINGEWIRIVKDGIVVSQASFEITII